MKTIIHKADTRGYFDHGWLKTNHTFSFARYHNPDRVNFGALRVLNDDTVEAGNGFGRHPHDNMEIITIPLHGELLHKDSMGNAEILKTGEVQVMSAGTGIFHEEHNASKNELLSLLQIWIFTDTKNIKPVYGQTYYEPNAALNAWQKLVTKSEEGTLHIHQDAVISRVFLSEGNSIEYSFRPQSFGSYVFIIEGEAETAGIKLSRRDGIGIYDAGNFSIKALKNSHILNIEVPE